MFARAEQNRLTEMTIGRRLVILGMTLGLLSGAVDARQREINAAAVLLAEDIAATTKLSVAVVDFTDLQGQVTELGRFVAEEMALGLVMARKNLSVVDRTHLKTLMEEHKLSTSGVIDPTTARQLGKIVGVQALVTGTITPFPDSVRVVIKVLDTDTARILAASSMDIAKTQTVESLLSRDISKGAGSSSGTSTPASSTSSNRPAAPGNTAMPTLQRGPLRVSVGQIAAVKKNVSLSLSVENVSPEPVYLAFSGYRDPAVTLTDELANRYSVSGHSGIPVVQNAGTKKDRGEFARIDPGESLNQVIRFSAYGADVGTMFSFSTVVWVWGAQGSQSISVGLSGLKAAAK